MSYRTSVVYPYLHFTAYSVTSTSSVKGNCVKHTGSPVPLVDQYIVSVDLTLISDAGSSYITKDASAITAEYSFFLDHAYSSLNAAMGYEGCTATLPPSPVVPTLLYPLVVWSSSSASASASATATALDSTTKAESSVSVRHLNTTQIIIVSVIVTTAGLIILLLCFVTIRRYRKERSQATLVKQPDMTSDTQLYVDQKAELEDEERRKYELSSTGIMYEMEGEDRIFEMPSDAGTQTKIASLQGIHEMRGAEHSKELEVPGNAS